MPQIIKMKKSMKQVKATQFPNIQKGMNIKKKEKKKGRMGFRGQNVLGFEPRPISGKDQRPAAHHLRYHFLIE